jgi:hypothetical protein
MSQPLRIRKALTEVVKPKTLLTGRDYIPAAEHTGASGLRRFLDRQIARGLKPREHKDYFKDGTF